MCSRYACVDSAHVFTACVLRYNGFSLVYVVLLLLMPLLQDPTSNAGMVALFDLANNSSVKAALPIFA